MNRQQLVSAIEQTSSFSPERARIDLEQYCTDASAAVELAFIAGVMHDDLNGRLVLDLGTGTGRLALACLFLGAGVAVGIEVDPVASALAWKNAGALGLENRFHVVTGDVHALPSRLTAAGTTGSAAREGITVVMNPPFGVHGRGADLKFLQVAMALPEADAIYSIHLSGKKNREFLARNVAASGWRVDQLFTTAMTLPWLYKFHEKKRKEIQVDIYRLARATDKVLESAGKPTDH